MLKAQWTPNQPPRYSHYIFYRNVIGNSSTTRCHIIDNINNVLYQLRNNAQHNEFVKQHYSINNIKTIANSLLIATPSTQRNHVLQSHIQNLFKNTKHRLYSTNYSAILVTPQLLTKLQFITYYPRDCLFNWNGLIVERRLMHDIFLNKQ